jgi:hypothetical protein
VANSLFDGDDYEETLRRARQPAGRVAIANSDAGGDAYAHLAIDHAERAVHETAETVGFGKPHLTYTPYRFSPRARR